MLTGNKEKSSHSSDDSNKRRPSKSRTKRKVCPFVLDKNLVLDFKNFRMIYRFVTETGKIVPRRVSGVTAKNQRKLSKHIKRARNLGLIAANTEL